MSHFRNRTPSDKPITFNGHGGTVYGAWVICASKTHDTSLACIGPGPVAWCSGKLTKGRRLLGPGNLPHRCSFTI